MKLGEILKKINLDFEIFGDENIEVEDVAIDSRIIKKNGCFFALKGQNLDGKNFVLNAIKNGAKIIVSDSFFEGAVCIKTQNVNDFLTEFLKIYFPILPENIYAITGTNGKSSTVEFVRQILNFLGKKSASIGTNGINCDENVKAKLQNFELTTPDIISLYKNLAILKENQINDVAIEASSIGLEQGRIKGLDIKFAAFTNFSQDHLDYHKTMQNYFDCKMILFKNILPKSSFVCLNADINEFFKIKKICEENNHKILDYGKNAKDLKIKEIKKNGEFILEFRNKNYEIKTNIIGDFQIYNLLCALGFVMLKYDLSENELQNLFDKFQNLKTAIGRMEKIAEIDGAKIFVDFAHSPDAIENILKNARKLNPNRLIILFGCGGNRDVTKRPKMGKIACDLADLVVVSDDNPRNEDANLIRKDILQGCDMAKTIEIAGRKEAIEKSLQLLKPQDILILAGKGHEKYQIIGDKKFEFDEEKIIKEFLKNEIFNI